MAFVIGLVVFVAVLWWLYRFKQRDIGHCQEVLGLAPVPRAVSRRGTTPEGFAFVERDVLQGTMLGRPAVLAHRTVRSPLAPRRQRHGSDFTVLALTLDAPARVSIRLQPTGVLGSVETLVRGGATDRVAIDPTFDEAWVVYCDSPTAAVTLLTPALRERLLAFRAQIAGELPTSTAGKMASAFVVGTFHIDGAEARYLAFGSPTRATAEQVKAAAPVMVEVAAGAGSR